MGNMFNGATSFNQPLNDWNTESVTNMNLMFISASSFNQDISGWNVSAVTGMGNMFTLATAFDQNLGPWYITPEEVDFDAAGTSLSVTAITAQNAFLDGQNPVYGIGTGGDSRFFEVASGTLSFKESPTRNGTHQVTVTAAGDIFESGNNHRTVTVVPSSACPPRISPRRSSPSWGATPLPSPSATTTTTPGATCRDETDGIRSVTTDNLVVATRVGNYEVTYSCSDSSGNDASAVRDVRVRGDPSDIIVETPTIPVITISGSNPAYIGVGDRYDDAGATCSDSFNATLPVRTTHAVDTSESSTHTVTYTCSNGWHHPQTATRTVIVSGGTSGVGSAPTIHLLAQGGTYYGGTYTFKDYNCVDHEDGIINHRVKVSVAAGASTATVTYTCTDRNGNVATATRTVQITDTRPPVVSINGPVEIRLTVGDSYTEMGATCKSTTARAESAATIDPLAEQRRHLDAGQLRRRLLLPGRPGQRGVRRPRGHCGGPDGVNARPVLTVSDEAIYLNKNDSYTPAHGHLHRRRGRRPGSRGGRRRERKEGRHLRGLLHLHGHQGGHGGHQRHHLRGRAVAAAGEVRPPGGVFWPGRRGPSPAGAALPAADLSPAAPPGPARFRGQAPAPFRLDGWPPADAPYGAGLTFTYSDPVAKLPALSVHV